jgi:hypothetical protein
MTFDLPTQKWTELTSGDFVAWTVSPSHEYLYFTTGGADQKAMRIRFSDHRIDTITSLKAIRRPRDGGQIGVAPDGSFLLTRDVGTQEIYALTVKWP